MCAEFIYFVRINEVKKMNYEIVNMDLFGEKFRRMYIREPMTVHEIYAGILKYIHLLLR